MPEGLQRRLELAPLQASSLSLKVRTADGFELDALADFKPAGAPAVIFAHGMTVDKHGEGIFNRAYDSLSALGFSVLRFDFRAHGLSQGSSLEDFHPSGQVKDLEAMAALCREKGCGSLGLAGASFGGGTAALFCGLHPREVQALFLANPLIRYDSFIRPVAPWQKSVFTGWEAELAENGFVGLKAGWTDMVMGRQFFDEMKGLDPLAALEKHAGPQMAVHGGLDDMVDMPSTREAFLEHSPAGSRFEVIQGAGHGFHAEPFETQVADLCIRFFREHLGNL